ncbi:hypothetical protein FQA39_LY02870 [Lamprigera yunnana]|nr:hypothetical protein FQA39_LY02870 [Lamprigera yunnana]
MFGTVSFVTLQFKILQLYLKRLIPLCQKEGNVKKCLSQMGSSKRYQFHVTKAIRFHTQVIKAAKEGEETLQGPILTYLMMCLLLTCLDVYTASLHSITKVRLFQLIAECFTVLASLTLICYYGEELAFNSEEVGSVVYEMDFVGMDPSFQKDLMLVIKRSQKGIRIKPVGLVELSMNTAVGHCNCLLLDFTEPSEQNSFSYSPQQQTFVTPENVKEILKGSTQWNTEAGPSWASDSSHLTFNTPTKTYSSATKPSRTLFISDNEKHAGAIIIYTYFIRKKLGCFITKLESDFVADGRRGDKDEEIATLKTWSTFNQNQRRIVTLTSSVSLPVHAIYTLVTRIKSSDYRDWKLPWGTLTFVNTTYSPNFELLWMYQNFAYFFVYINILPIILIMFGTILFVTLQFKILQLYLKRLIRLCQKEGNVNKCSSQLSSRKSYQFHMTNAIRFHVQIIKVAEEGEKALQGPILTYLMMNLILTCLEVYNASTFLVTNVRLLLLAVESFSILASVTLICYYGEELAFNSEEVGNVVYEMDYVGIDPSFQKDLMLVIRRSQKGIRIKPAGLVELSMNTAVWKINIKNAWNLRMIDYMRTVLISTFQINSTLQVAGTSLDVGTKIYVIRVDDVHSNSLKLASSMMRTNTQQPREDCQNLAMKFLCYRSDEKAWVNYGCRANVDFLRKYPIKIRKLSNINICPEFADFEIDQWNIEDEQRLFLRENDESGVAYDKEGLPIPELDGTVHNIFEEESQFTGENNANRRRKVRIPKAKPKPINFATNFSSVHTTRKVLVKDGLDRPLMSKPLYLHKVDKDILEDSIASVELNNNDNNNNYYDSFNSKENNASFLEEIQDCNENVPYGECLVDLPEMVPTTYIPHAHKSKTINMKKLKTAIWKTLVEDTNLQGDEDIYKKRIKVRKFFEVYNDLPKFLSKRAIEELSCPLAFVALLHLANDQNLKLTKIENKNDFTIAQCKSYLDATQY